MALRTDRLQALRKERGWSQRELARACGIADAVVRKYEVGFNEPSATSLKLMAQTLEVSTDYLLGLTDDPTGHSDNREVSEEEQHILDTFRRDSWKGLLRIVTEQIAK